MRKGRQYIDIAIEENYGRNKEVQRYIFILDFKVYEKLKYILTF